MPKLVLFDIDETIIKSDGAGRRAIERALSEIFSLNDQLPQITMSGKTDPQICQEILALLGFSSDHIESKLDATFKLYTDYLEQEILGSSRFRLHEGIIGILEILAQQESVHLGLLTGNIEPGARIKLQPFQLNSYFTMGAFGSDSADRMKLPAVAASRAHQHFGISFAPSDMIIIGDAINDIKCAKGYGAVSLAVNTGKTTWSELEALQPDHLFANLTDTKLVLEAILA